MTATQAVLPDVGPGKFEFGPWYSNFVKIDTLWIYLNLTRKNERKKQWYTKAILITKTTFPFNYTKGLWIGYMEIMVQKCCTL